MTQKFGTRRKKNKDETRRVIFDTAYELFEEKGYAKMTMRDLASKAGVGLGTIFQHFKDKSTLLVSVFEHEFQPIVDQAFASVPHKGFEKTIVIFGPTVLLILCQPTAHIPDTYKRALY